MRIDRSHIPWALTIGTLSVIAGIFFLANFYPGSLPFPFRLPERWFGEIPPVRRTFGGTPLGIIYGSVAFLIFLFASALGIRKKKRLWRIGNVQTWLKAHIWLTLFTVPLVAFHCGFHWGGTQTTMLLILYIIVMASGIFGLVLQHFMPRIMKESLPREVVFEQIPHIQGLLFEAALKLRQELRVAERTAREPVAAVAGTVETSPPASPADDPSLPVIADFLDQEGLPYLSKKRRGRPRLADSKTSDDVFRLLKLNVSEKWQPRIDDLQIWCDDRRMMDLQLRLHHLLHGWLLVHVPVSFALLVMTAWHAWIAVRYLVTLPA